MRPRVFPAEDRVEPGEDEVPATASMRPRVFPAEDKAASEQDSAIAAASMRPRVFPAEDRRWRDLLPRSPSSFNEAAGIPRGRPLPALAVVDRPAYRLQ